METSNLTNAAEISDDADYKSLLQTSQRDINRMSDSDRMTRKRGLQKLLEDLPWKSKKQKGSLAKLIIAHLIAPLIGSIADPVEKCRELSISLLSLSLGVTFLRQPTDSAAPPSSATSLSISYIDDDTVVKIVRSLCERVGDVPFPETSEELRLQVVELIKTVLNYQATSGSTSTQNQPVCEPVVTAMSRTLTDTFPAVKRAGAEVVCILAEMAPTLVRMSFKSLLKALVVNATHQHSKTRSATLQAIGLGLSCVTEEYEGIMKEPVMPLLSRMVTDRSAGTRKELCSMCEAVVCRRLVAFGRSSIDALLSSSRTSESGSKGGAADGKTDIVIPGATAVCADVQLIALLVLLRGDESEEVAQSALNSLQTVAKTWSTATVYSPDDAMNVDIDDAEAELRKRSSEQASSSTEGGVTVSTSTGTATGNAEKDVLVSLLRCYLYPLAKVITEGVGDWTSDTRRRNLLGLRVLIEVCGNAVEALLPQLFSCLSTPIRDEDASIRSAAEGCCAAIGACVRPEVALDLLIPRVAGQVAGGDTFSQRTSALRLLTHIFKGFPLQATLGNASGAYTSLYDCAVAISSAVADPRLYEFREAAIREAALLLLRALVEVCPEGASATAPPSSGGKSLQGNIVLSLIYLQARCPGEEDIVPEVARKDLQRLAYLVKAGASGQTPTAPAPTAAAAGTSGSRSVIPPAAPTDISPTELAALTDICVAKYFNHILTVIVSSEAISGSQFAGSVVNLNWQPGSVAKAAFDSLVRTCNSQAWANYSRVLDIIVPQVQPKKGPAEGSAEANMRSYAAVRGEEEIPSAGEVDVRLALLALLEGMIRAGASDWQCGVHIADASERVLCKALVPNLIWRVGRVEATVRKVALAATYGLLKAGAAKHEALMAAAPEMVPMLTGNLDDLDESARLISCLCLTVMFDRLRGAFGDQAVHELYHKLLKRLDDSSDQVRIAICSTLEVFLVAANKKCYSGTTIDYTLDQLFIHLDDPDPAMQQAVLKVIVVAGNHVDRDLVLKKAEINRGSHRTPDLCNKVIFEVQGCEILED